MSPLEVSPVNKGNLTNKFKINFKLTPILSALIALLVLSIVLTISSEYFFKASNFINLLKQISIVGITGVGATLVMISGGIDLSVGSMISLSAVLVAGFMQNYGIPPSSAVILVLIIGAVLGLINGAMVAFLHIPPIVATLATLIAYRGIALVYTGGYTIDLVGKFETLGRGFLGPIPVPALIMIGTSVIGFIILKYTLLGRVIYGLGGNEKAMYLSGHPVRKYKLVIYMICGITAALAGVVLASRVSCGPPMGGDGIEIDVIASAALGGVLIGGGVGGIENTLVGAFLLTVINNGLNLMDISPYVYYIVKGAILAVAVAINAMRRFQKT